MYILLFFILVVKFVFNMFVYEKFTILRERDFVRILKVSNLYLGFFEWYIKIYGK